MSRDGEPFALIIGLETSQGDDMSKLCLGLATAFFLTAISFSGCCAPMGPIGPGCANMSCNDCSGCGTATRYIANGPIDALRNARRRMTCGSGCGEAYMGEWISTPPDAMDPCCGEQFVGGASKCRPFCWQPGTMIRGLYGSRFCSGDASSTPCGCSDSLCDGSCGFASRQIISGGPVSAPVASPSCGSSSGGCSSGVCSANAQPAQSTTTQVVRNVPSADRATSAQRRATAQQTNVRVRKEVQKVVR